MQETQNIWDLWQDPFREREIKKYKQPLPSREFILQCLNQYAKPLKAQELAQKFDIEDRLEVLEIRLRSMEREGQIFKNRNGAYALPDKLSLIKGRVDAHKDGYGWLIVEDKNLEDVYLSAKQMRRLWHGDIVLAKEVAAKQRGKTEAIVVEILERGISTLVGRIKLDKSKNFAQVFVENKHILHQVLVSASDLNQAKDADLVEVEILEHPSFKFQASGKVIRIFDEVDAMATFLEVTAKNHNIDIEFAPEVLQEAESFGTQVSAQEKSNRFDLTKTNFVTIDGEDAKDFDDAVYCEWLDSGNFKLLVAIADVAAYVKENSHLDLEAKSRGNSVYFPNRVIPMLPFALSDNLCSLMPDQERLTLVCELEISASGKVENFCFYKALIKSYARLTYTQVGDYISGNLDQNPKLIELLSKKSQLSKLLDNMSFLHKNLLNMRYRRHSINFDRQEVKVIFNDDGKIEKIVKAEKNIAYSLIEEFMLCANVAAANLILQYKLDAMFRNHEKPNGENLEDLQRFLLNLGLKLEGGLEPTAKDYGLVLQQIKSRPDFEIIQTMLLRSMQQAVYSEENRGHFALAYDSYTHFTSPIRRYPDLILHREITNLIEKCQTENIQAKHIRTFATLDKTSADKADKTNKTSKTSKKGMALKDFNSEEMQPKQNIKQNKEEIKKDLHNLGLHLSKKERSADLASRDVMDYLKCIYIQDYLGEVFVGKVVNVTGFGLFVELEDLFIDGLIHISSLPADYYIHEAKLQMLKGKRTKRVFKLGDKLEIQVAGISVEERKIDFALYTGKLQKKQLLNKSIEFLGDKKMQDDLDKTENSNTTSKPENTGNTQKPATQTGAAAKPAVAKTTETKATETKATEAKNLATKSASAIGDSDKPAQSSTNSTSSTKTAGATPRKRASTRTRSAESTSEAKTTSGTKTTNTRNTRAKPATSRAKTQQTQAKTKEQTEQVVQKTQTQQAPKVATAKTEPTTAPATKIARAKAPTTKATSTETATAKAETAKVETVKVETSKAKSAGVLEVIKPKAAEVNLDEIKDMAEVINQVEIDKQTKKKINEKAIKKAIEKKLAKKAAQKAEKKKEKKKLKEKIKKHQQKLKKKQKKELKEKKELKAKVKEIKKQMKQLDE